MAINKTELVRWLSTLADDDLIAVDEGGLSLVALAGRTETEYGHYLEVGGIPEDDEDSPSIYDENDEPANDDIDEREER